MDNKPYILTEEDKKAIADTIGLEVDKSENLKVLAELPSNNGVEEHVPEEGNIKNVNISVNPETGEKVVLGIAGEGKNIREKMREIGESINDTFDVDICSINAEDMRNVIESDDSLIGKQEISDEAILKLIDVISLYKEKKEIRFKDLPEEVQNIVDTYICANGLASYSNQANQARNVVANALIEQYITQIELEKFNENFQSEVENLYKNTKDELSPLMMEYSENREEYLTKLTDSIEDENKKELAKKILDSVHGAFSLERLKAIAPTIKIKNFDYEKPKRAFDGFLNRYRDTASHIYDIYMCTNILHKHLIQNNIIEESDNKYALKVMIGFARFCCTNNYNPNNPEQHAFMYYFTNNIVLLDIYSGEQYQKYAPAFLKNIQEFHDLLR